MKDCNNPHCGRPAHEPESCDTDARCSSCAYCLERDRAIAVAAGEIKG